MRWLSVLILSLLSIGMASGAEAAAVSGHQGPAIAGIPLEFFIFGATLLGVAIFHKSTFQVALTGLAALLVLKLGFSVFGPYPGEAAGHPGFGGLLTHLHHEWGILANLTCLLFGFGLLANYFERSHLPALLPRILPSGVAGAWLLLVLICVISSFLDNIAAAMIGGTVATVVFKGRVHIGYVAAIVAASNAGGAGSVVGDTTTTMMWLDGVPPAQVLHAFVGSAVCMLVLVIAARQQSRHQPMVEHPAGAAGERMDWACMGIVALILAFAIGANIFANLAIPADAPAWMQSFPWIGVAVWVAILIGAGIRKPDWSLIPGSWKGVVFLLALVTCASLMPVRELPRPGWQTACGLGFLSAVFDNIPLTKLALEQGAQDWGVGGGYDWGFVAYAVGFGGSMLWFGSSAGVAIANKFPEAKSTMQWLRHGWHVALAYVLGFAVMMVWPGWHPHKPHKGAAADAAVSAPAVHP